MEYAPGVKINRVAELARLGVDRKLLARRAVEAYLQQLLTYGFFHAGARPPARAPRAGGPGSRSELCLVSRQARFPVGTERDSGRRDSLVFSAQIGQLWASPGFQWEGSCGWHAASFGQPLHRLGPVMACTHRRTCGRPAPGQHCGGRGGRRAAHLLWCAEATFLCDAAPSPGCAALRGRRPCNVASAQHAFQHAM